MDLIEQDASPLCCCEYIDIKRERNHILACCCNCQEFDNCFEKLITCKKVSKSEAGNVTMLCLDRIRCPWRGGAVPFTFDILLPTILQPLLAFTIVHYFDSLALLISLVVLFYVLLSFHFTKNNSRSQFLYYWIASSIIYSFILFQGVIVPLAEIKIIENLILIICTVTSVFFFYTTKVHSNRNNVVEYQNGELIGNGVANESICPVCRIKIYPRNYHCHICQNCVPAYDYHCFWLNCCIGGNNHSFFMAGLFFGTATLIYASLLILTTICQPTFVFGILLPDNCTEVFGNVEASIGFLCGVYCMELGLLLLARLLHHIWLISKGFSALEWKDQFSYSLFQSSPFSRGCVANWIYLLKSLKKSYM